MFYFFKVIRLFGLKGGIIISTFLRFFALILLAFWTQVQSWFILSIFLGAGSFIYIILMQIWISNIKFKKFKGVIYSVFGVAWYITIYGVRNDLSMFEASILLSAFMIGSVCLDLPITWLSEYINRNHMIVYCALLCTLFAIFLPLAIYDKYNAYALLFVWGGVISSMYSNCLILIEEKYDSDKSVLAMAAFSFMENAGAAVALIFIGILFGFSDIGTDGFSYVIMLASIVYFTFALARYTIQIEEPSS